MEDYYLVADIGATNARFAVLAGNVYAPPIHHATLPAISYDNLTQAVNVFLKQIRIPCFKGACIAIAGPVHEGTFGLANNHWQVSKQDVHAVLSCPVLWINDFAAQAWGISSLASNDTVVIKDGIIKSKGNKLVIGPGSGLGVAGLISSNGKQMVVVGEGGHVSFAPGNDLEIEVLRYLFTKYEHVSVERLASGSGIPELYNALAHILNLPPKHNSAAQIADDALSTSDPLSMQTMDVFFGVLGQTVASAALQMGALGGVYLVGGVLPKLKSQLEASQFEQRFLCRGRFRNYLESIPIYLSLNQNLGLEGAALALRSHLEC